MANVKNTIEYLEGRFWGDLPLDTTKLVKQCYTLRKKALSEFTIEDLRLMIGQKEGLAYLVPIALDLLFINPFIEGDLYEGDLLECLLKCDCDFWVSNITLASGMDQIVVKAKTQIDDVDIIEKIKNQLRELFLMYENCRELRK